MITRDSRPSRLVLDQKPGMVAWFLAAFVLAWVYISITILKSGDPIGWIFLAAVIIPLFFLTFVERQTLTLDRDADALILTRQTIFKKRQMIDELGLVRGAKIRWRGEGSTRSGRLVLQRDTGPLEFGSPQRQSRAQSLAREVNAWLDSKGPTA